MENMTGWRDDNRAQMIGEQGLRTSPTKAWPEGLSMLQCRSHVHLVA